jgi:alpha-L-rhamnosidase
LFIDWHPIDKDGDVCVEQLLFYRSLCVMEEIATLCGKADDATRYGAMAKDLARKIEETYWREDLGAYVSVFRENEKIDEVRRHQNYLAILFGLADEKRTARIVETVLRNPEIPPLTTSFYKFFECDVLCRCGFIEEAFAEIRRYYGGMLKLGATSFWEEFNENEKGVEHYAMYGDPFDRSLCHAWGAGTLYFIGRYQAGVKPLSPGWQQYEVKPCLTMGYFSATIPVGEGQVKVSFENGTLTVLSDRDGGCLTVGQESCVISKNQPITMAI